MAENPKPTESDDIENLDLGSIDLGEEVPASEAEDSDAAPVSKDPPTRAELKGRKIGRILVRMGRATREQVQEALGLQSQRRLPLGQLLIELGYITEQDVSDALAAQAGMETLDLGAMEIPKEVIDTLPAETAQAYQVMPLGYEKETNTLTVALKDPNNFRALDDLRLLMGYNVKAVVADGTQVDRLLGQHYGGSTESLASLINDLASDSKLDVLKNSDKSIDLEELIEMAEDNKVKRLLNLVLLQAIKDKASDIHFEPFEDEFRMRYRIDGVLYEMIPPPKHLAMPITSRVKVMSNLDIAERRMPQDGRIQLQVGGRQVDMRVAVLPTMFGESVVMRVLDRSAVSLDLEKLGLRTEDLNTVRQLINKPNGIVIVTGPTGSGKTTTLYSALNELNDVGTKICTAEDPVEYDIDGLIQVQVAPDQGLTFAKALRSFLRQDPDIVLVGETRDIETARISVQAALTGHLVFTTLHTNDAPSTVARLMDLGLESFLITATIEGIIAQRLVRRVCMRCKEAYTPTETQLLQLALTPEDMKGRQVFRGRGCDVCSQTGYRGRMGLYELLVFNDELRELVMQGASTNIIRAEALKSGMRTLRQCGLLGIFDGVTSIDEVVKETLADED